MNQENEKTDVVAVEPSSVNLVGNPQDRLKQGNEAAKALMSVAQPVTIQGNQYLTIGDWQTVGAFYGFFAGAEEAEPVIVDGVSGFRAKAVVRTSDGTIVSSAVAYCFDEGIWKGREKFAQASMAQTRASSKALRMVVGWVAVLGGYKDTPAEEMDYTDKPQSQAQSQDNDFVCPKCEGGVWDNRIDDIDGKKITNEKNHPAFKCKDKNCDFASWKCEPSDAGVQLETPPHRLVEDENYEEAVETADSELPF